MMKEKIVYLEFLRVICAVVVVLDHICIAGIHIFGRNATLFEKFFYNGIQHWSHFAVPVFLMISGYLLLDSRREIGYKKAITKYAWRMVAVLLTVGTVFAWMEIFFSTKSFAPSGLLIALWNTVQGDTWKHLWYLYTLVGLYLVLPVIKPIFDRLKTRELDIFLVLFFFFGSIMPLVTSFTGFKLGVTMPICCIYLFYFMMGRRIGIMEKKRIGQTFSIIIFGLLSIGLFIFAYCEYYLNMIEIEKLSVYSSPIVVCAGIFVFYAAKEMDVKLSKIYSGGVKISIQHLADNSFGIYIFHMLWVNIIYKVVKFNPLEYGVWVIVSMMLLILVASDITTLVYKRIPYIGKFI